MIDKVITLIMIILFLSLGTMVRLKKIPPISTEYITSRANKKIELKSNEEEIHFISSVFLLLSFWFILIFLGIIFPEIIFLKLITYSFGILIVIYALYKGISSEMKRGKNKEM